MAGFFNFNPDDYKDEEKNDLLPTGTYEMIIKSVEMRVTKGNHQYMNFDLVVRDDLDKVPELAKTNAKQHRRHLFTSIWTLKDDEGNDTGEFDMRVIGYILQIAGVPPTNFSSWEELLNSLFNRPVRTSVTIRENEYQGQKRKQNESTARFYKKGAEKPSYTGWFKTQYPLQPAMQQQLAESNPATAGGQDPFPTNEGTQTATDDDLPF